MESSNKRKVGGEIPRSGVHVHHQSLPDNRNPLLNDVVLTRLFELCHLSDLPRFRLVSKKWHALASDTFRRDVQVEFGSPSSSRHRFEALFELDPEKMPFGNFRMKHMPIGQDPTLLGLEECASPTLMAILRFRKELEQLWGRYGSCLRKLELCYPVVHNVEAFKKLILEETPNLEELSLLQIQDETGNLPRDIVDGKNIKMQRNLKRIVVNPLCSLPFGWDLLRHFPNIQSVEVTPRHLDTIFMENARIAVYLIKISEQLSKTRRRSRIAVHELNFWLRSEEHVNVSKKILKIPQLFLPRLHFLMEFSDEDCEMDLLSTAFLHQGENLEDLYVRSLSRQSPYDIFPFKPGPFKSTTSIDLRGNLCENLHFLQHFPNLKVLQMGDFGEELLEGTESAIMETFTLPALKELILDMDSHISKDKMEILTKVMPSVETFHGRLINESLRILCRDWKQLKVLFLETTSQLHLRINDEGITGIISGRDGRLPNITDLEDLKSLSITKVKGLSDASIWHGFLQMPNLRNLHAKISPDASENAFGALTEKFAGEDSEISRGSSCIEEDLP